MVKKEKFETLSEKNISSSLILFKKERNQELKQFEALESSNYMYASIYSA